MGLGLVRGLLMHVFGAFGSLKSDLLQRRQQIPGHEERYAGLESLNCSLKVGPGIFPSKGNSFAPRGLKAEVNVNIPVEPLDVCSEHQDKHVSRWNANRLAHARTQRMAERASLQTAPQLEGK